MGTTLQNRPDVQVINYKGEEIMRLAKRIDDLPTAECRLEALKSATISIAKRVGMTPRTNICFGMPVYWSFSMTRNEAKKHTDHKILLTPGFSLSLDFCEDYC